MQANTDFTQRLRFDDDAALYDRARPRYPAEVFSAIADMTGISPPATILEAGCGSGQATVDLGRMGYNVTALEPGKRLSRIARENCATLPNVRVVTGFFEDWDGPRGGFDAIVSANAWHWIRPADAYPKAAALLNDRGHLAVFWNFPEIEDESVSRDIRRIANETAPGAQDLSFLRGVLEQVDGLMDRGIAESVGDGLFIHAGMRTVTCRLVMNAQRFAEWICTYSNVRALEKRDRENLVAALEEYVGGLEGGVISLINRHVLRVSRKTAPAGL